MAEHKLSGREYRIQAPTAMEALDLLAELTEVAGPLAPRIPLMIGGLSDEDPNGRLYADAALLEAMSAIIKTAGKDRVTAIVRRVVEMAEIRRPSGQYERVDLDGDFTGGLQDIFPLARLVLKETLYGFFTGKEASGILGRLTAVLAKPK